MSKTVAPVVIAVIGAVAVSASMAMAQSSLPSAPPPPPQIKSARISCKMSGEVGQRFELSGQLGNWRLTNQNQPMLTLRINAPDEPSFSGDYGAFPSSLADFDLSRFDTATYGSFKGFLRAGYGRKGMIMLESAIGRAVGICETSVSPDPLELPA
jgi:hypothetical protein